MDIVICRCSHLLTITVFFGGEFSPPGDQKKRAGESNKGIFENFKRKFAISWGKKKKLKVARFRQCVPLSRQN